MAHAESGVESIFFAALEKPSPDERAAFLADACAGKPELRQRVEKLLRAHPHVGRFLEIEPPPRAAEQPRRSECPGTIIGRYKLLEQIGEGGFGVVFMAEQTEPVRRRVALKIVKPGMDTRQVIARFEAERQALALMDHPQIAKVLDAGATESGRPYFVMELVRGIPITDYCDQHRLALRERLQLFVTVCAAIQHAHLKGIIHRDIKPSNVLVTLYDGKPVAKVIDFGIAKAIGERLTEKTLFTNFAQMIGTPLYMSPEQAELSGNDVDTRSDVYSLGVLLYELLTGTTPFDKERLRRAAFDEILRIIRDEEPPRPSTRLSTLGPTVAAVSAHRGSDPARLTRLFRGELDWIVMKALEKDRTRRYESAGAFAADIQRRLRNEPVEAGPPSRVYRLRKFVQRRWTTVVAAAGVSLSLIAGTAASVWQMLDAQSARRQAEKNLAVARDAVERYLTAVSESRLLETPGLEPLRKELLESALSYHRVFLQSAGRDPLSQAELAAASIRVGRIRAAMDDPAAALASLEAGFDVVETLLGDPAAPRDALRRLAGVHGADQSQYHSTRPPPDPARSRRATERGIRLWERLARDDPDQAGFRCDLAVLYGDVAELQAGAGERHEAVQSLNRSRELWRELVRRDPTSPRYRVGLADCCERLGLVLRGAGDADEMLAAYREQLDLAQQLADDAPGKVAYQILLARSRSSLGKALLSKGSSAGAALLQQALDSYRRVSAAFPTVPAYREETAIAAFDLAIQLSEDGRPQAAAASLREAIDLLQRIADDFPQQSDHRRRLARYHYSLGLIQDQAELPGEAAAAYRRAAEIRERLVSEHGQTARYLEELAWQLAACPHADLRDPPRAVQLAQAAVQLAPRNGNCWKTLGVAQYRAGDDDGAIRSLERALEFPISSRAPDWFLAMAHWRRGARDEARACYDRARRWMDQHRPHNQELQSFRREAELLFPAGASEVGVDPGSRDADAPGARLEH